MKYSHIFFLALAVVVFGCKTNSEPDDTTIQQLFPFAVGNSWTYHVVGYNSQGIKDEDTTGSWNIIAAQTFDGHSGYILDPGDSSERPLVYYFGPDLFSVNKPLDASPHIEHILHYPMNPGETYVMRDTTYPDSTRSRDVLYFHGSGESLTVPAGSFACYHFENIHLYGTVHAMDTDSRSVLYFAKNVGLVKEQDYYKEDSVTHYSGYEELVKYTVK